MGLPDADGLDVLRRLCEWTHLPILILSVRDQEPQKIAALDAGAADDLTKPFGAANSLPACACSSAVRNPRVK